MAFGDLIPVLKRDDVRLAADVVNLSSVSLTANQLTALNLGVKFHQSPSNMPMLQLVAGCENAARSLDPVDGAAASSFRIACAKELEKASLPKPNMTVRHQKALKDLCKNESIVITTADKGGKVVVLDLNQYSEMVLMHLQDPAYEIIPEFGSGRGHVDLQVENLLNENFVKLDPCDQML